MELQEGPTRFHTFIIGCVSLDWCSLLGLFQPTMSRLLPGMGTGAHQSHSSAAAAAAAGGCHDTFVFSFLLWFLLIFLLSVSRWFPRKPILYLGILRSCVPCFFLVRLLFKSGSLIWLILHVSLGMERWTVEVCVVIIELVPPLVNVVGSFSF
eukprot:RCo014290